MRSALLNEAPALEVAAPGTSDELLTALLARPEAERQVPVRLELQ